MADLIEREAVMKALQVIHSHDGMELSANVDYVEACNAIYNIPAVDAEPVQHGRWIGRPLCGNDDCRCSNCGYWENVHANIRGEITQKYCPNCGARMGMEEE